MAVFRLSRRRFARSLNGRGAALTGGRWNSRGTELIYTASNRSLAMAEVAVHLTLATLPKDYVMSTIRLPDDVSLDSLDASKLKVGWNAFPHRSFTQKIGDAFVVMREFLALRVPSAVTKGDFNILINPNHDEFRKVQIIAIEPFPFDSRIFR